jgi:hypothetical protein
LVVVPVVAGGVTSAVVMPDAGIPVALATFLAMVVSYGRVVLAVGSVGLLVTVDDMVTAGQSKFHYVAEFGWPTHFETASTLAWLAVAALAADALVQEVRERRGGGAETAEGRSSATPTRPTPRTGPRHAKRGRGM